MEELRSSAGFFAPMKGSPTVATPSPPHLTTPTLYPYHARSTGKPFELDAAFVESFRGVPPPFGFNGLGELVYLRTYSRVKPNGDKEQWFETVARVVNGTYRMQQEWVEGNDLGWKPDKAQRSAQEMYRRIFELKFSPPGRGLWAMGSPLTESKKLYATLNNCAFVSTVEMARDPAKPFTFLMDASMLGIGVGFDTRGAGLATVRGIDQSIPPIVYQVPDSREGWVDSTRALIAAYFEHTADLVFDYSLVRPAGQPIRGFGGVASGPQALLDLHERIRTTLNPRIGKTINVTAIVDIMNHIGVCVVSGNVRRSSEIVLGEHDSEEFLNLKNYGVNPERIAHGWVSNNSIFARVGMEYDNACQLVQNNGEPGFAWLDNMRGYGRMGHGEPDNRDKRVMGGNPCLEQSLEPYEMCCLVETFPFRHRDMHDFERTLKFAYMYAKTVTLGRTHWPETNQVMLRNRRIGCSMSGIAQFITEHGLDELRVWCQRGYNTIQHYDEIYSNWLAIPRSIKTTSIKPSGTVSLLAGATPGMHYPISQCYLRRVRIGKDDPIVKSLENAGYRVEPTVGSEATTVCVEFPIDVGRGIRPANTVSMWEQLSLAAFLQKHWSDNQVSCTVSFDPHTEGPQIKHALDYFQYQLKGVSFLPNDGMRYPQMPYEEISQEVYRARRSVLKSVDYTSITGMADAVPERGCDGDSCTR